MTRTDPGAERRVMAYVEPKRAEIAAALRGFLDRKGAELGRVSPLGTAACGKLAEFAARGKMVRGALVCWAAELGGPGDAGGPAPVAVGAAMELFQSALLVHDDIMDRDTERRGRPSVHHQYVLEAARDGMRDPEHLGSSLGICAGDIAFFLAFELMGELAVEAEVRARLVSLFARELSLVGVAQMMDMAAAAAAAERSVEEILRLYLYKTGRYTFSLPLLAGAALAGVDAPRAAALDRAGEELGMLFQIKDDEIGLFGDPADTGKPVGSDVREGKKTVFHAALLKRCAAGERERLAACWGAGGASDAEVREVLDAMERAGVREEVGRLAAATATRAAAVLAPPEYAFLRDLLAWSLGRTR